MPKESRSSNNEEMIRIPHGRLQAVARELRELIVADHPVAPVADDVILQIFCVNGEPALAGAGAVFNKEQALKTRREIQFLIPVDPTEFEWLRAAAQGQLRLIRSLREELTETYRMSGTDALRVQLAERDALLRSKSGSLIQLAAGLLGSLLRELQGLQN
jgi:hypothetical protein